MTQKRERVNSWTKYEERILRGLSKEALSVRAQSKDEWVFKQWKKASRKDDKVRPRTIKAIAFRRRMLNMAKFPPSGGNNPVTVKNVKRVAHKVSADAPSVESDDKRLGHNMVKVTIQVGGSSPITTTCSKRIASTSLPAMLKALLA